MSERKPDVLLKHYLKKLKLPTILREYQSMAAGCTKERCDYTTFLLRLVERESPHSLNCRCNSVESIYVKKPGVNLNENQRKRTCSE
jgi:hypothetical protein